MNQRKKVIIIGGGTAGITIANYLQDYFQVSVIEKSKNNKYPLIFKVPLLIGILFRRKKTKYINKTEFLLKNGRTIPFYESNLLGGASVMNGAVHVFGFKSKWKLILDKFKFSIEDLNESNDKIYSFDRNEKNKITLANAKLNEVDNAFIETLQKQNINVDDMSHSEKQACGAIQNTVRKYFRTSVLSILKKRRFDVFINEKVDSFILNDEGEVTGVRTNKGIRNADYVILSAGVIGSCSLILNQKNKDTSGRFSSLSVGKKIQDHTNLRVNVSANKPLNSLNEVYSSVFKKLFLGIKHFLGIPTVMRGTGATSGAYLDLDKDGDIDTRIQILQFSEAGRHGSKGSVFKSSKPGFSISINAIHPESTGSIQLNGEKVIVDPNFLSSKKDIEILKLALKYCVDLLKSQPLSDYVLKIDDEETILNDPEKYIQELMYSGHHLIGGLQDDIDSNFEVKNIKRLYVCDASIFDRYVASNIHSSVVLLADMFAKSFVEKNRF
ncbi:GMC oxidoreductase [Leptospira perdikensis]|uniref:GMC family oxidoreductase n=1 Tax=Leptospira perdikensis TaxID=2484948 RepID=A0A4R9JK22_9LEPT|nr:GMC oxidoreductase [Leptospira perdikensis]TGL45826.1 GMC family oxidoreductase [Leptospira perdikensis]